MDTVYITGHRNPDTDSIVSAMAYAALKNALGQRQYRAARLGQISDETKAVLQKFDAQPPELIHNVRTQVRDLVYDTPPTLSPAATISRAWQMMQADHISVMPVCNEDGTLYGMLSAGDVANYDMLAVRNSGVKNVPVFNLLSVLEGKIINEGGELRDEISGEVTVALPRSPAVPNSSGPKNRLSISLGSFRMASSSACSAGERAGLRSHFSYSCMKSICSTSL